MPPSTFCQHDKIMNIKRSEKEKEEVSYETLQTKGEVGVGIRMRNTCKSMADSFQYTTKPTTIL